MKLFRVSLARKKNTFDKQLTGTEANFLLAPWKGITCTTMLMSGNVREKKQSIYPQEDQYSADGLSFYTHEGKKKLLCLHLGSLTEKK